MLNHLEATVQTIIHDAALAMARQIARAVRQSLAAEITGNAHAAAQHGSQHRGRPAGAKAAVATKAPAAKAVKATRKRAKRRAITKAELDAVLAVIARKPGLGRLGIQKAAGIDSRQAERVLNKLRATKAVKLKGERSKATYSVA